MARGVCPYFTAIFPMFLYVGEFIPLIMSFLEVGRQLGSLRATGCGVPSCKPSSSSAPKDPAATRSTCVIKTPNKFRALASLPTTVFKLMLHVLTCNRASAQIYGLSMANFREICYKRPSLEWLLHIGPLSS